MIRQLLRKVKYKHESFQFIITLSAREGSCLLYAVKRSFCVRIGEEGLTAIEPFEVIGVDLL